MKLNKLLITGALAASALASMSANAATIGSIPGTGLTDNAFVNVIFGGGTNAAWQIEGWYNEQLFVTEATTIDVQYFGAEAILQNTFSAGGATIKHNGSHAPTPVNGTITGNPVTAGGGVDYTSTGPVALGAFSFAVGPGLVPFSFISGDTVPQVVVNGANPVNTNPFIANFFVAYTGAGGNFGNKWNLDTTVGGGTANNGTVAWLFLDDGLGGPDDNHDDMIIRLTVRNGRFGVPEPATLGLMGLGLLGMGALRRRKLSA